MQEIQTQGLMLGEQAPLRGELTPWPLFPFLIVQLTLKVGLVSKRKPGFVEEWCPDLQRPVGQTIDGYDREKRRDAGTG